MTRLLFATLATAMVVLNGCKQKEETLFRLLSAEQTGIDFANTIVETDSFNILTYEYIYNGGGVAIADFNNDSQPDIFFTGNQVPNRLYLNQGNFRFTDITESTGVNVPGRWNVGASVADINGDGWQDIYVAAATMPDSINRQNMLFINQGNNKNGLPIFKEMASDYGINFSGHTMHSAFFDYDKDGDLDLYLLVNVRLNNIPSNYRPKIIDGSSPNNDRLYRNEGNGKFTDVTLDAGILFEGFGLGLSVNDFNNDTWPDLYVSNDYQSDDILYINQKNGTFKNLTKEFIFHQSQFSMGNDAADINNDGYYDLVTLDMLPENSERKKTTIGNKSYQTYINNETFDYSYQHIRNMLHLNNNAGSGYKFSEIGQLAGVQQTEWSWSPLLVDFDNDGWRDLVVTNGFPKDITDKDFSNYRAEIINIASPDQLIDSIPVVKIPNYAFRNQGNLTFQNVSASWGLDKMSFSNGAAYADLDGDGDLDYVVNNINDKAFVFENTLKKDESTNFLRIKLVGPTNNKNGIGAEIRIKQKGHNQYHFHSTARGYLSTVEEAIHFGLGSLKKVDSLVIRWPDGKTQMLQNVEANMVYTINYNEALRDQQFDTYVPSEPKGFRDVSKQVGLLYSHSQIDLIDFNIQRTLPHKYSQFGPALSVGDINNDGLEDLFVGGSAGNKPIFFLQDSKGNFSKVDNLLPLSEDSYSTDDLGSLLVDVDNDKDLDLYLVKGGFEYEKDNSAYQDVLYLNDGKGKFTQAMEALPPTTSSGSCVRAGDYDADGDLDLFVGGRVVPGQYPLAPQSYLLKNESGKFRDATAEVSPDLKNMGMITDAIWSDFNNDGKLDLIVVGELMPIRILKNDGVSLKSEPTELDAYKGWWNSIVSSDFDKDGDMDYVAGNLGLNNQYNVTKDRPVKVFAKDLDGNGSVEALTFCYTKMNDGSDQLCPVHFWDELNQQSPRFRRQFSKYKQFSKATMATLLSEKDLEGALLLDGNFSQSAYIENLGGGKFDVSALPKLAQVAPVNGLVSTDVNSDGNTDIVLVGNDFGNEVFIGRMDALNGLVLMGDGTGNFTVSQTRQSGFYVPNDAKALVRLVSNKTELIVASQNKGELKTFSKVQNEPYLEIRPEAYDVYALVSFADGKKQKVEFPIGSGFLSQSTRSVQIYGKVTEVQVYNSQGQSRTLKNSAL